MACSAHAAPRSRPALEVADIVRAAGDAYCADHRLSVQQARVLRAIVQCRTAALGGHTTQCDHCGALAISYCSCRNRHCPKCQTLAKERWLERQCADLLDIEYWHLVFTLPHDLNPLAQGNPELIYRLLFRAASATLLEFGRNPRWIGAELGITMVLHTWGQRLDQHIHVHCVVTGGGLSPDGQRWIAAKPGFLFPTRALSAVFRGKYLEALALAYRRGELRFAGATATLSDPGAFRLFLAKLKTHPWVVYAKPPFGGATQVLAYLGRYTHRVAIANHRLVSFENGEVRFRWRDYAHANKTKIMTLSAQEFLRRFLLHTLPPGFVRIRHYGVLGNRCRHEKLARCRALLEQPEPEPHAPESVEDMMLRLTGIDTQRCPVCQKGRLRVITLLAPTAPFPPIIPKATGPPL
ncbi:MAG: IS91 family transposase [Shimia sp.]|jgi:hypothetical protein|nr:IS91 family transposase [Shimia sp.]